MKELEVALEDAEALDAKIVGGLQRVVGHAVTTSTAKARSEHRWQDRTGATRNSIVGQVTDTGKGAEGHVDVGENAARLATGTAPHVITAGERKVSGGRDAAGRFLKGSTRPGMLRFQVGGQTVFARSVNHPGTRPDPYLDQAAEAAGEDLFAATEQMLDELLDG